MIAEGAPTDLLTIARQGATETHGTVSAAAAADFTVRVARLVARFGRAPTTGGS